MKRVLVFDSGVGGLSVLDAIIAAGRELTLDYAADNAWLPYGAKSDAALKARVPALLTALVSEAAPDLVVMACNTASTIALEETRAALTIPVVGVVPPIKPAAERTKTGAIGLLATPATIGRPYVDDLIARFAPNTRVIRFGSTALVDAAEAKLAGETPKPEAFTEAIHGLFNAGAPIDIVALACTHFPLLELELAAAAPSPVAWLSSGEAIARRVITLLDPPPGVPQCARAFSTAPLSARPFEARGFAQRFNLDAGFAPNPVAKT
jgi:glutamate racemase